MNLASCHFPLPLSYLSKNLGLTVACKPENESYRKSIGIGLFGWYGGTIQSKHNFSKLNMSLVAL
jgi:hypothetical protein